MNYGKSWSSIDAKNKKDIINLEYKSHEELAVMAHKGDNAALEYLINTYKNVVKARVRRFFLIGGDYEDLIQEGTIGLFKAIREYNPDRNNSFAAFAELCIQRQLYTSIKAANRKKHTPLNNSISLDMPIDEDSNKTASDRYTDQTVQSPDEILESEEKLSNINQIINTVLSPMEKIVINLYLEGLNYREIAQQMKKSDKSIDNALNRAKNKLRKEIYK